MHFILCSTPHKEAICYFVTLICFTWQVTRKWNYLQYRREEILASNSALRSDVGLAELIIRSAGYQKTSTDTGCMSESACLCVPVQSPAPWAGPPSFTCLTKMVSIGSRRFRCLPDNERESTCTNPIGLKVMKSSSGAKSRSYCTGTENSTAVMLW